MNHLRKNNTLTPRILDYPQLALLTPHLPKPRNIPNLDFSSSRLAIETPLHHGSELDLTPKQFYNKSPSINPRVES